MSAGWFSDPSGRFGQRWYDGHTWTEQVVAANGTIQDPLPAGGVPYPPPQAAPRQQAFAPPAPAAPAAAPAAPGAPGAPAGRLRPGATLGIALLGLLLVALSLLGVPWTSEGPGFNFFDLNESARDVGASEEPVVWAYAVGGGFVLLLGAMLGVVLAGTPLPGTPRAAAGWRVVVSAGSALAVVLHTVTVARVFRGPVTPDIGAWLGVVGYFIIILAMVVGHYRRRT